MFDDPLVNTLFAVVLGLIVLGGIVSVWVRITRRTARMTQSPLIQAAVAGDLETVKRLLSEGADVDKGNSAKETPLFLAAGKGNREVVEYLLKAGADVNRKTRRTLTWLPEILAVDIAPNRGARTPLAEAIIQKKNDVARILMKAGGIAEDGDTGSSTPVSLFAVLKENFDFALELINGGEKLSDENVRVMFYRAIARDRVDVCKALMRKGADANSSYAGNPMLVVAIEQGSPNTLRLLIEKGADLKVTSGTGQVPSAVAKKLEAKQHKKEIQEILADAGAL